MSFRALYVINAHDDSRTATVARDASLNEYRVRFHDAGPAADYFTNDEDDAVATARHVLNDSPKPTPCEVSVAVGEYNHAVFTLRQIVLRGSPEAYAEAVQRIVAASAGLRRCRETIPL